MIPAILPRPRRAPAPAILAGLFLLLVGCGGSRPLGPDGPAAVDAGPGSETALAIVDVRLVPMDREAVLPGRTVMVRDGRIVAAGPTEEITVPDGAGIVGGDGRYLFPGLVDMHVHLDRADLAAYVAHGVTTVRNMWGFPDVLAMRDEIEAGTLVGPTIHSVSPGIDGSPPRWPFTQLLDDPALADSVVQAQEDAGWRTLKLYQDLSRASYDSVVAAAHRRGLRYVGHTPTAVGLDRVLQAGQRSIEHLGGFAGELGGTGTRGARRWSTADPSRMPALAARTAASGAWICPTLAIQLELQGSLGADVRESAAESRRRMVRALHEAGARLLVGTDAGIDVVQPGASLVTEMEQFVRAGLSPYQVLSLATRGAAAYLELEGEIGVIRPGARADLVLVDGNPLEDVGALSSPAGVVLRGRWRRTER